MFKNRFYQAIGGQQRRYINTQPFEITIPAGQTSATATITRVGTSYSFISFGGFTTDNTGTTQREYNARVELTNATTVTAYRNTSSASFGVTVRGTVIEFYPDIIKSVQPGVLSVSTASASGTASINSIDVNNSVVYYLGTTNDSNNTAQNTTLSRIELTNATTVTATRHSSYTPALSVGFVVVEFQPGYIQSIQRRSVTLTSTTTTGTDTITSVATGNTIIIYNGLSALNATATNFSYNVSLTNSTTVTLERTGTNSNTRTINYTALEFVDGIISVQRGTTAIASATSADTSISSVNTAKSFLMWNGFSTTASSTDERFATAKLNTSTQVRAQKNSAGTTTSTPAWEVVSWLT